MKPLQPLCGLLLAVHAAALPASGHAAASPCRDLAPAGVWQNVTPPQVSLDPNLVIPNGFNQFGVGAFVVDPMNVGTIYLGTCEQGIYKSVDCGTTWTHVNAGRGAHDLDTGMQWTMAIDPSDSRVLYANAGYSSNALYRSVNGGVDWDKAFDAGVMTHFQFGGFVETVVIDAADHRHLLATMHEDCVGGAAPGCVVESSDAGATWHTIDGAWGGSGESSGIDMLDSDTWLYAVPFTQPSGIWRTGDRGLHWTHVYDRFPNTGVARGNNGTLYLPDQQGGLLRSIDYGLSWTEIPGSPNPTSSVLTLAGNVYTSFCDAYGTTPHAQYFSAAESNLGSWRAVSGAPLTQGAGRNALAYDAALKVLYSSNQLSGFWRVVMPVPDEIFADGFE